MRMIMIMMVITIMNNNSRQLKGRILTENIKKVLYFHDQLQRARLIMMLIIQIVSKARTVEIGWMVKTRE